MKRISIQSFILLLTLGFGQSNIGTTGASFLDIGIGARSLSMGGAFTSIANDVTAIYWNPAGIVNLKRPTAQFFHAPWIADINFNYGAAVVPLGKIGSVGISMTSVTMNEMKVRTLESQDGTGELFDVSNLALSASYAKRLTDRFSFGLNLKFIQEKIWHMAAKSFAVDIGSLFITKNKGIRIGMSISNFGSKMRMDGFDTQKDFDIDENIYGNNDRIDAHLDTQGWPLPLVFRVGMSQDIIDSKIHKLTLAGDAIHPNNTYEYLNLGLEYTFMGIASIRAGQSYLFLEKDPTLSEDITGLAFGAGLNYKIPRGPRIQLDYVIRDFGVFNNISGYSLNISF